MSAKLSLAASLIWMQDFPRRAHRALRTHPENVRIRRGVYARFEAGLPRWQLRRQIALARATSIFVPGREPDRPDRALCLRSAALVWGLPVLSEPLEVELWSPHHRVFKFSAITAANGGVTALAARSRCYRHRLTAAGLVRRNGVWVTSLEQLILDAARFLPPAEATVIIDAAYAALCRPDRRQRAASEARFGHIHGQLSRHLEAMSPRRRTRRGSGMLTWAHPWSESPGESILRWQALALGLPPPRCQAEMEVESRRFYVDLCWPQFGVAVEFDGKTKYGATGAEELWAEKQREDLLRQKLPRFGRFTFQDLRLPTAIGRQRVGRAGTLLTWQQTEDSSRQFSQPDHRSDRHGRQRFGLIGSGLSALACQRLLNLFPGTVLADLQRRTELI